MVEPVLVISSALVSPRMLESTIVAEPLVTPIPPLRPETVQSETLIEPLLITLMAICADPSKLQSLITMPTAASTVIVLLPSRKRSPLNS